MRDGQANPCESGRIFINLIIFLFFSVFCVVLYLARRPILRFTAESWIIEDPLDKADAVIILGDDNFYADRATRSEEHTSELQSRLHLVCRLLLEKKKDWHQNATS